MWESAEEFGALLVFAEHRQDAPFIPPKNFLLLGVDEGLYLGIILNTPQRLSCQDCLRRVPDLQVLWQIKALQTEPDRPHGIFDFRASHG